MKKSLLSLFFLSCIFTCWPQYKRVDIYFPDSVQEKEITLMYSIHNILNYFYEPYTNTQKTKKDKLSFTIPDSISTFLVNISPFTLPYRWNSFTTLLIPQGGQLSIYLDSIQPARFEGDNACLHYFIYKIKNGTGFERAEETLSAFKENSSTTSFYDFANQEIAIHTAFLDSLLLSACIDPFSYTFAKNQMIDEYLFRAELIGTMSSEKYRSVTDSASFFVDLNKLFTQYDTAYDWGLSSTLKADYRARGLISYPKLSLGLDSISFSISYLNKYEQEKAAATEIIANTVGGKLDSMQLDKQRNIYKEVFPHSIYNPVLNQLKPPTQKGYVFASYSIEYGFFDYGSVKIALRDMVNMFMEGGPMLVDFWATWCSPCIKEFERNKELDTFLKENNIKKLYISVDFAGAYDKWKQRIEKSQLEGFHYLGTPEIADQLSYFDEDNSIPRYVLLDKNGFTLIDKCELPSSGKLIPQIKEKLGIN